MAHSGNLEDRVQRAIGVRPVGFSRLSGGCVGDVRLARFEREASVVVKVDGPGSTSLDIEGRMLEALRARSDLPVPSVLHAEPGLLIIEHIDHDGGTSRAAEEDAAAQLAALHSVTAPAFGFEFDTVIAGLPQPNGWTDSWIEFFAERRLVEMARQALEAGRIDASLLRGVERLAGRLDRWLDEPDAPSLVHGDVWSGNVLCRNGRVAAFIDPAIYFAHAEVELAFITLFGTFGERFFEAYSGLGTLNTGFFEARRDLYNLYPLLVHARLFGGGYAPQAAAIVDRFAGR